MKCVKIRRQRDDSLELLHRLSDQPRCSITLMEELSWSPEWLDEQISALRRRSIKVRRHDGERLSISKSIYPRARRRGDAYARAMGYDLPTSVRPGGASLACPLNRARPVSHQQP